MSVEVAFSQSECPAGIAPPLPRYLVAAGDLEPRQVHKSPLPLGIPLRA